MESGSVAVTDQPDPMLAAALDSYGNILRVVGRSAAEACPITGRELDETLNALAARLTAETTRTASAEAERHLSSWGAQTAEHLKSKADEVKELMMMLARTAESVGERDQRYSNQFSGLTADLKTVANLDDITQVRRSLLRIPPAS